MTKFTLALLVDANLDRFGIISRNITKKLPSNFMRDFTAKFQLLADNQEIGKRQDDFIVEMRMSPFKKYHIYYFPTAEGVEIYRVPHGERNLQGEFGDFFEGLK